MFGWCAARWSVSHTAKTQYQKFKTYIPRKGIARPKSQFPHSSVCERFIYSHDRSAYSAAGKYVDRSCEYILCSQTHGCGNWDSYRAIPRKGIHIWVFRCSALISKNWTDMTKTMHGVTWFSRSPLLATRRPTPDLETPPPHSHPPPTGRGTGSKIYECFSDKNRTECMTAENHEWTAAWMKRNLKGGGRLSSEGIILVKVVSRNSSKVEVVNNDFKIQGEIFFEFLLHILDSTLLLLLAFYCVGACWEMGSKTKPGLLRLWHWQFVALNTWLDLISFSLFISVQRCI